MPRYIPRNPSRVHPSFPVKPSNVFESPEVFEKFSSDTLFFIFYHQQNTYQQYLAARVLKTKLWRYHKEIKTWFQRSDEGPKVKTEEHERGTYIYFDFETGWCQRIKSDFTLPYNALEDELIYDHLVK